MSGAVRRPLEAGLAVILGPCAWCDAGPKKLEHRWLCNTLGARAESKNESDDGEDDKEGNAE